MGLCSIPGITVCIFDVTSFVLHVVSLPVYIFVIGLFLYRRNIFAGSFYIFAIWLGITDIFNIGIGLWTTFTDDYYLITLFTFWLLGLGSFFTFAIAVNRLTFMLLMTGAKSIWTPFRTHMAALMCLVLVAIYALPSAFMETEKHAYGTSLIRNGTSTVAIIQGQMVTLVLISTMVVMIYVVILIKVLQSAMRVGGEKFTKRELKLCIQAAVITLPVLGAALLFTLIEAGVVSFYKYISFFTLLVTISRTINPYVYLGVNSTLQDVIRKKQINPTAVAPVSFHVQSVKTVVRK